MSTHPSAWLERLSLYTPTFAVFMAVLVGAVVVRLRERQASRLGRGLRSGLRRRRHRVPALAVGTSGLWVLPLLVWGVVGSSEVRSFFFGCPSAWSATPYALQILFECALALGILIVLQSLAVNALSGPGGPRQGLDRGQRVAARFVIATVFLDGFLVAFFA